MAVIQISRIQHRRGLEADLPNLSSAELGWSVDTRKLYIGNGTTEEGAPSLGKTEVLTQYSILNFTAGFSANIVIIEDKLVAINSNATLLSDRVVSLENGSLGSTAANIVAGAVNATITSITSNNAIINYTLGQGANARTGTITMSRGNGTVTYAEEYTETATTDVVFTMNANITTANLNYSASTSANLFYRISSIY